MVDICHFFRVLLAHLKEINCDGNRNGRTTSTFWMHFRLPILTVLGNMMSYCVGLPTSDKDQNQKRQLSSIITDCFELVYEMDSVFAPSFEQLSSFCAELMEAASPQILAEKETFGLEDWIRRALEWFLKSCHLQATQKKVLQAFLNSSESQHSVKQPRLMHRFFKPS